MSKDLIFKYGESENLPADITPGTVYFTRNTKTGQGEIFYDVPDDTLSETDKKRFSVISGGIYVGEEDFPEHYNLKIDPSGLSTGEAYCDENGIYYSGIMSAEDKRKLDQLWKYFGNLQINITDTPPSSTEPATIDTLTFVIQSP